MTQLLAAENSPGIDAKRSVIFRFTTAVARQATSHGEHPKLGDRGHPVAECHSGKLFDPTWQELIGADHECVRPNLSQGCKHRIEIAFRACMQYMELQPKRRRSRL